LQVAEAIEVMRKRRVDCLPVVVAGRLVGMLTSHDLLGAFLGGGEAWLHPGPAVTDATGL
jgi:CBS domain-containing protein